MRLLNALTKELEFFPDPVPDTIPYAILSHTWEMEEVTFADMEDPGAATAKLGYAKVLSACEKTLDHGLSYIWIDTCCIDKSSSAELSEAINTMFRWYQNSAICFTFLSDFPRGGEIELQLQQCRWFTRGWTLQELIAPRNLLFFNQEWDVVGTKAELGEEVEAITGVSRWILDGSTSLSSIPLAKRMSWAAGRRTTREEDIAYCLLGIFDVNMPMIYGEGSRAFTRLQEEILRRTSDLSIFAWQSDSAVRQFRGLLAESPAEFGGCSQIELNDDQFSFRDEISLTNRGVKIQTALQYLGGDTYIMDLHCYRFLPASNESERLGICLRRTQDTYLRSSPHQTARAQTAGADSTLPRPIYLMLTADEEISRSLLHSGETARSIGISLPTSSSNFRIHNIKAVPETYWEAHDRYFSIGTLNSFVCFVRFSVTSVATVHYQRNEETTAFILVCDLNGKELRLTLYAQTGLQSSPKPERFIDPFTNIDDYGPLGDAFSLNILRPGSIEDRKVQIIHRNPRNNYVVTAGFAGSTPPANRFRVSVSVFPDNSGVLGGGDVKPDAPSPGNPHYDPYGGHRVAASGAPH